MVQIVLVYFIAVLAALGFSMFIWILYAWIRRGGDKAAAAILIYLIGLAPVVVEVGQARRAEEAGIYTELWIPPWQLLFASQWLSRLFTYSTLAISAILIVRGVTRSKAGGRAGTPLFLGYFGMAVWPFVSSFAGTQPWFSHFMIFAPLIFLGIYLSQPHLDVGWLITQLKRVLLVYVFASLALFVVLPEWASASAMVIVPGLTRRLHGITSHSNTLAALGLLYLTMELGFPSRRILRATGLLAAIIVIVLAQSKTVWVGATVILLVHFLIFSQRAARGSDKAGDRARLGRGAVVAFVSASACASVALLASGSLHWLPSGVYESLVTLTGRTIIWEITLQSWRENPLFGYGPGLWGPEYRLAHGLYYVGTAHNQFVHTLGESGLFGLAGLVSYVLILAILAIRFARQTGGVSLGLIIIVLARTISEAPLRNLALDGTFLLHFSLFILLLTLCVREPVGASTPPSRT
jgi:O-antigen ligase